MPTTVPSPQEGAFVCVPTILDETPDSSIKIVISDHSVRTTNSKRKELRNEIKKTEKIISAKEGQKFLKLIKRNDFKIANQFCQTS